MRTLKSLSTTISLSASVRSKLNKSVGRKYKRNVFIKIIVQAMRARHGKEVQQCQTKKEKRVTTQ